MRYIFTIIGILLVSYSNAQTSKMYARDSFWISHSVKVPIGLNSTTLHSAPPNNALPFSRFVVKNVTADTSYIGVKAKRIELTASSTYEKVVLKKGTSLSLEEYLNNPTYFSFTKSGTNLTCYVKKFRITEIDSSDKITNNKEVYHRLTFEAEGYLDKDNLYFPALRIDTVATAFSTDKNDFSLLENLLDAFAVKAALIDTEKVFKRSGYTAVDLEKRYQQRFTKPILLADHLTAGVYKTFNELLNNDPWAKRYEFKRNKAVATLYTLNSQNEWVTERAAFGFCDGKVIWINARNVFYPLIRQGNTFEFLGVFKIGTVHRIGHVGSSSNLVVALGAAVVANTLEDVMTEDPSVKMVYQLNMENGTFY